MTGLDTPNGRSGSIAETVSLNPIPGKELSFSSGAESSASLSVTLQKRQQKLCTAYMVR